jgi:hypothetical protein
MGTPGNANTAGGGGGMGPFFRDALDAKRAAWNQTPEAMYPPGYLGTIYTRRQDRVLDSLKARQNERSYVRGIHKGERIDPADYLYPGALQPTQGMERMQEAEPIDFGTQWLVERYAPRLDLVPSLTLKQQTLWGADPGIGRTTQLRKLAPPWSTFP